MESNIDDDKKKIGFYVIHNPVTDKIYIGSGLLGNRKSTHERMLDRNEHWNYKLQRAYNENPNFEFIGVPVEEGTLDEQRNTALNLEQITINELKGDPSLLNIAMDVERPMTGYKHSEVTNEKNRQSTTKRWQDPEFREKVTAAQREGWSNLSDVDREELKKKRSSKLLDDYSSGKRKSLAGQTRSDEFKEKNSENIKKKWEDPVYRETQRIGRIGKMIAPNKTALMGDGVQYDSMTAAGNAIGVTKQCIMHRLDSPNYPGWFRI